MAEAQTDSPHHHYEQTRFPVPESWQGRPWIDRASYERMYERSLRDPDGFWGEQAERLDWMRRPRTVRNASFDPVDIRWFEDGTLNACANCVDRHLDSRGDQVALIWEGDEPDRDAHITYAALHEQVCRLANAMKARGAGKGSRVTIYMPMVPEAVYAMLACARIGAVHSVVFGGFSPDSLADRIADCESDFLITADEGVRGGKTIPLKANADRAVARCPQVHTVMVVRRTGAAIDWQADRDLWYHEAVEAAAPDCPPEEMAAEDPLFILYTSGSTGKPKGVLHTTGGYLLHSALTHQYVFDYQDGDIYWCTADVGWITGHSYIVYGPLANGATSLIFEGVPTYPDSGRFWQVVDKHKVNIFYTAPTAIRALMRQGEAPVKAADRGSLKLLGTVGEPINPEAWMWYHQVVGDGRCPIIDSWWQTETGGIMIAPLPGATDLKPGSATLPFFGVEPRLVDNEGRVLEGEARGNLVIAQPWPGQARTLYGDHERFETTYFAAFKGCYFTGDGARRDADGYYWITGRVDDVLNVSGHRMGTAEIESALVAHEAVAEAAVVGVPHEIKGQGIYAYVTLIEGVAPSEDLRAALITHVREDIGAIATPEAIHFAPALPKTRSGKIMRRILRKIAAGEAEQLGDISTLADPGVVETLVADRANR